MLLETFRIHSQMRPCMQKYIPKQHTSHFRINARVLNFTSTTRSCIFAKREPFLNMGYIKQTDLVTRWKNRRLQFSTFDRASFLFIMYQFFKNNLLYKYCIIEFYFIQNYIFFGMVLHELKC